MDPGRRSLLKAGGGLAALGGFAFATGALPVRTHLRDIRLVNYRNAALTVDLRLDADGETVYETSLDLDAGEQTHLPCAWPGAAWAYEIAVRLPNQDTWTTSRWDDDGDQCKKIAIREPDHDHVISFFVSPNCENIDTSCG